MSNPFFIRNQSGQIIFILPILIGLTLGSLYLFDSLKPLFMQTRNSVDRLSIELQAETLANRIRARIPRTSCGDLFSQIRDFSIPQVSLSFDLSQLGTNPCFVDETELPRITQLQVNVSRQPPSPDLVAASVQIQIQLEMQGSQGNTRNRTFLTRSYKMSLVHPMSFGLIVRPIQRFLFELNRPAVNAQGLLRIQALTFATPSAFPLQWFSPLPTPTEPYPPVVFERPVLMSSSVLSYPTTSVLDVELFQRSYQGGLLSAAFGTGPESAMIYPWVDLPASWDQPIDWSQHWQAGTYPLVEGMHIRGYPTSTFDPSKASFDTLPSPLVGGSLASDLSSTCAPSDTTIGSLNPMVFMRNADLTIDFDASTGPKAFCGLILAKNLTIRADNPNAWYALIGSFNVSSINVVGQGKVILINPEDTLQLPPELSTLNVDLRSVYQQMKAQSSNVAHNFFVPFRKLHNVGPPFPPEFRTAYFSSDMFTEPNCDATADRCWKTTIPPPPSPMTLFPDHKDNVVFRLERAI